MTVLVVAAHPDDEVIGAGATVAKEAANGTEVHVSFLSDGVTSRHEEMTPSVEAEIDRRRDRAEAACEHLGVESVSFGDFPDNSFDDVPLLDIVQHVEDEVEAVSPERVYTHHHGDLNIDHELAARAVTTAARPLPDSGVDEVLAFPTVSSTEWSLPTADNSFRPTVFVEVTDYVDSKIEALATYEDELRDHPHPRSTENVRRTLYLHGATAGVEAAEPFELVRSVRR